MTALRKLAFKRWFVRCFVLKKGKTTGSHYAFRYSKRGKAKTFIYPLCLYQDTSRQKTQISELHSTVCPCRCSNTNIYHYNNTPLVLSEKLVQLFSTYHNR